MEEGEVLKTCVTLSAINDTYVIEWHPTSHLKLGHNAMLQVRSGCKAFCVCEIALTLIYHSAPVHTEHLQLPLRHHLQYI